MATTTIDFGAGNTDRFYASVNELVLPVAGAWSIGMWVRPDRLVAAAAGRKHIFSGISGGLANFEMWLGPSDPYFGGTDDSGNNTGGYDFYYGFDLPGDGTGFLAVFQSRYDSGDAVYKLEAYMVAKGATGVTHFGYPFASGQADDITLSTIIIGSGSLSPDPDFGKLWIDPLGELFVLTNDLLEDSEVESLAAGASILTIRPTPQVYLKFREDNSTEPDVAGNGYDATQYGTGWTTAAEFFEDTAFTSPVANDSELQWDILKLLNADSDLRWDVRQSIIQDSDLRWNVLQTVQHDSDLRWSILANIIKDSDLRWSILKLINTDSDLRWSVLQMIYRDLELRWDSAGSNSTVFSDSTLQWSIIATIAQSLTLDWNVLQTITQDADIRWAILTAVAKDFEARWDVRQALQADATIGWNIIGTASKTITLRWNIQSDTAFEDISGVITVNSKTGQITALSKTPVITTL